MWVVAVGKYISRRIADLRQRKRLTPVQQRHLAGLLVGNRKGVFETTVPITKLVAPPLLRLDALTTNFLPATGGAKTMMR